MNYGRITSFNAEKFYDLIKLNNEFREYDFKKNLEIKLHLCEAAEKTGKRRRHHFRFPPITETASGIP